MSAEHVFTSFYPTGGLGAGASGALEEYVYLGRDTARFVSLGSVDIDPEACVDFEMFTGSPALCADLHTLMPADLLAWMTDKHGAKVAQRRPDFVFLSPPCKGFSALLSSKTAASPRYQLLNELVFKALFLVCEMWNPRPPMIIIENVPKIQTRGAKLLLQCQEFLRGYGYLFHRAVHDCGEIGGLAQHRKRFLLIARDPKQVPAYVYQPPKKRVRGCGEVLGTLPLPQDPSAGILHRLPKISFLNWKRLSVIKPGEDWRYLKQISKLLSPNWNPNAHRNKLAVGDWTEPSGTVTGSTRPASGGASVADPRGLQLGRTGENADAWGGRPGMMGVLDWQQPSPAVIGKASVSGGHASAAVADPRTQGLAVNSRDNRFSDQYRVREWDQPAGTVTGATDVQEGAQLVADPRFRGSLGVRGWDQPADTVTGESYPSNGSASVADPRLRDLVPSTGHHGSYGVQPWSDPAKTVTTGSHPSCGPASVGDPRLPSLGISDPTRGGALGVIDWSSPAPTITGQIRTGSNTPSAVGDPRLPLMVPDAFGNVNRVLRWDEPSGTVTHSPAPSSGGGAVADPRLPSLENSDPTRGGALGVLDWSEPARTITGNVSVSGGNAPGAVADPRIELGHAPRNGAFEVQAWGEPADAVRGRADIRTGPAAVADPRLVSYQVIDWRFEPVELICQPREGTYGVLDWRQAIGTVTGNARIDNGTFAVADPRPLQGLPDGWEPPDGVIPVIISPWGLWHRPLTTLELAVLQGLPATLKGKPLELAGRSVARWRERIGNAVPRQAGKAIAGSVLKALLASTVGGWGIMHSADGTAIWVRRDGRTEYELGPVAELAEAAVQ